MNEGGDKMVTNAGAGSAIRSSAKRSIPEGVAEILLHRKQYGASKVYLTRPSKVSTWPSSISFFSRSGYATSCTATPFSIAITPAVAALWPRIMKTGSMRMEP